MFHCNARFPLAELFPEMQFCRKFIAVFQWGTFVMRKARETGDAGLRLCWKGQGHCCLSGKSVTENRNNFPDLSASNNLESIETVMELCGVNTCHISIH